MTILDDSHVDLLAVSDEEDLAMVLSRYVDDMDRGVAPPPDQLVAAHPQLGDRLQKYLHSLNWFDRAVRQVKRNNGESNAQSHTSRFGHEDRFSECHLGDYRLLREIGRGGMGVVYEARQLSLGRTVALKLLPFSGLLDQKQIARFRNEAQAAAALHHPNIVPVFAVGCERGVHYYSMQFIDGQSLADVIADLGGQSPSNVANGAAQYERPIASPDDVTWEMPSTMDHAQIPNRTTVREVRSPRTSLAGNSASTRHRDYITNVVQLMVQAAEALQHAHECGVVHRDIKPSNLMLDRHSKLWITDFGLARCALGPDLTATGDVFGTIRYMSPEQAAGKTHLVDHRTDVYSLGVTMFELLTLDEAFAGDDRQAVLKRVQEEPLPSLRRLNPSVPYDLETIVFKAVAKTREDRYSSARELADDLRRFLAGEPTRARRPTLADRLVKWVARHKGIACSSLAAGMIALIGVSAAAAMLAAKQRETDGALGRAKIHFRQLQQVVDRFGAGVSEQLRGVEGAEAVRAELLKDTLSGYETLIDFASHDPTLVEDWAKAAYKAATVHEELGAYADARRLYLESRQAIANIATQHPQSSALRGDLAVIDCSRGSLEARLGNYRDGIAAMREAIVAQNQLRLTEPHEPRFKEEWALSQINLGLALSETGRDDAAASCYRQAMDVLREMPDGSDANQRWRRKLGTAMHNLSGLVAARDPAQAEELSREAAQILRDLPNHSARPELALVLSQLASVVSQQGKLSAAEPFFREAIAIQRELIKAAPHRASYRLDLGSTHNNFGQQCLKIGDFVTAERELCVARDVFEELVGDFADVPMHYVGLAAVLDNLGHVWQKTGKLDEAAQAYSRAVEMQDKACQRAPEVERYRKLLESHRNDLARIRRLLDQRLPTEGSEEDGTKVAQSTHS